MTIFDVQRFSVHDGPGIRTTVFLKGCPLRCLWCQNPEGLEFGLTAGLPGKLGKKCRSVTPEKLAEELQADNVFFEVSGGGVTFSGGEALAQIDEVCETAKILRLKKVHTAIETALYAPQKAVEKAIDAIDLVLADIKLFDAEAHRKAVGTDNTLILENFKYAAKKLKETGRLLVRTPLIPGHTADKENLQKIAAFICSVDKGIPWELLNFNPLASSKYTQLNNNAFAAFEGMKQFSDADMQQFKQIAASTGLKVL